MRAILSSFHLHTESMHCTREEMQTWLRIPNGIMEAIRMVIGRDIDGTRVSDRNTIRHHG
ncbi:hypothetical protein ACWD4V_12810 [Streptomyces tsukubensis]